MTRNDDLSVIKWTAALKQTLKRREQIRFEPERIRKVLYRPFVSLWLYDDDRILSQSKAAAAIFSKRESTGQAILIMRDQQLPFACFSSSRVSDLHATGRPTRIIPRQHTS